MGWVLFGRCKAINHPANPCRKMPPRHPYPTLHQRIIASRRCMQSNSPIMHIKSGLCYLLDQDLARSILTNHELQYDGSSDDDDDDGSSDNEVDDNMNKMKMFANLEKPNKPTVLLRDALTNANGDTWRRQRNIVVRAFAVIKATRGIYANHAVGVAIDVIDDLFAGRRLKGDGRSTVMQKNPFSFPQRLQIMRRNKDVVDVRCYAKEVAIQSLCKIVFGEQNCDSIIILLRQMFHDSLDPRRDEEMNKQSEAVVEKLDVAVREMIENLSKDALALENSTAGQPTTCDCLVRRLLHYIGETGKDDTGYLTKDEIVGNTHSALLAGIQTISTTLAGALLHLAERPHLQKALKDESISGKDIVNETLRILPPVAGLPRVPRKCDMEISSCPNVTLKKDQTIVIDVLSFVHAQKIPTNIDEPPLNTLLFDLTKKRKTTAKPWGLGKRSCPAGNISSECIRAILEALVKRDITWTLATEKKDGCVRKLMQNEARIGWLETISYRPTLTYMSPLRVRFSDARGRH